jgi:UDP-N-acetylglucosamine 2-epimerase (hydrolysing)
MSTRAPHPERHDGKALLFVTGTRADFGKIEPLALAAHSVGHKVGFFVTGMHMLGRYGMTKVEVHRHSHFHVTEFINHRDGDPQDVTLAKTIVGLSDFLQEHRPDLVIVHGDRIEALAATIVCATNGLMCAHVEGGEVSGNIDEQFRHCNTKLASVHLVSSDEAGARVVKLGESPDRVYVIGSPELDIHGRPSGVILEEVLARYEIRSAEYGVCIFHPVTSETASMSAQARQLFGALVDSGKYFVVILPNNDPGASAIVEVISELPAEQFRVLPSMRFAYFSELLRNAHVVVGNSSLGVREAPFLGVPSLNIGTRQTRRGDSDSIQHCVATDRAGISRALSSMWGRRYQRSVQFGTGNAAQLFTQLLRDPAFWTKSAQKFFVD